MNNIKPLGFWKRFFIVVLDALFLVIYYVIIINSILNKIAIPKGFPNSTIIFNGIMLFSLIGIPLIAIFLSWVYFGASLGKITFGVKIVDAETGLKPTKKQFLYRLLGQVLSYIGGFIGFICAGFDSRKQALHDKIAGTIVLKESNIDEYIENSLTVNAQKDRKRFKICLVFTVFIAIIFCTFVAVLHIDQELKPEVKQWLSYAPEIDKTPEQNGFYHLVGFGCVEEKDPFEEGLSWINAINKVAKESEKKGSYRINEAYKIEKIDFAEFNDYVFFAKDKTKIEEFCLTNQNKIDSLFTKFSFLEERYNKITSFPKFSNNSYPSNTSSAPDYYVLMFYKKLKLSKILTEFFKGNEEIMLKEMEKEIALSRFLLKNNHGLVGKIAGSVLLKLDLDAVGAMLNKPLSISLDWNLPEPQTKKEMDWTKTFKRVFLAFERVASLPFIDNPPRILYKKNRSMNNNFGKYKFLYDLSKMSAKDFIQNREKKIEMDFSDWDYIYNWIGTMYYTEALTGIYLKYIAFQHSTNNRINMLKLKQLIYKNKIKPKQIPNFLVANADSLHNVFDEKAFKWNEKESCIYYDTPIKHDEDIDNKEFILFKNQ